MFIVTVIPIGKAIGVDELSYFSAITPPLGSIIEVLVRKKKLLGIVQNIEPVKSQKGAIKRASFVLKKTDISESFNIFNPLYIEGLRIAAGFFATTLGALTYATCNKKLFAELLKYKVDENKINSNELRKKETYDKINEQWIFGGLQDRCKKYSELFLSKKNSLRKTFVVVCPSISHAKTVHAILTELIKKAKDTAHQTHNIALLAGPLSSKKITAILEKEYSIFVITGSYTGFPFARLNKNINIRNEVQFIIEEPDSLQYNSIQRPHINVAIIAKMIGGTYNDTVIFGSILNTKNPAENSFSKLQKSQIAYQKKDDKDGVVPYQLISQDIISRIEKIKKGKVFILGNRLGLATHVVCRDCTSSVTCNECGNLVKLYGAKNTTDRSHNTFMCHACGAKRDAHESCDQCGSWNLKAFGVGIEKIFEEVKKVLPQFDAFVASGEEIKNETWLAKWRTSTKAILVGTPAVLDAIYTDHAIHGTEIEYIVVSSFSQLINAPIHNSTEEALKILLKIDELSPFTLQIIDKKSNDNEIAKKLTNVELLLKESTADKKMLGYAPFGTIIMIEVAESKFAKNKLLFQILDILEDWKPTTFPMNNKIGNLHINRVVLKLPLSDWNENEQNENLKNALLSLPQSVSIKINPQSLIS